VSRCLHQPDVLLGKFGRDVIEQREKVRINPLYARDFLFSRDRT
jgi:hypothetical protein